MVHVAYRLWGGDGFFAKMTGVSMLSMFENTKSKVTVHIMHNDRLTPDNRDKLSYIAGQYNQNIEFHNVEMLAGDVLRKLEEVHPIKSGINASWYLLIVHEIFPDIDKIIFLGADTVFNLDINELWAYDLDQDGCGYGFAAAVDIKVPIYPLVKDGFVKHEDWFNVDVLLLKPSFFRENFEQILEACRFIYNKKYYFLENDVLNYLFSKKYLRLPYRFNSIVNDIRSVDSKPYQLKKAIYHYAGTKPDISNDDIFNQIYFEYFLKTPWANYKMFKNIFNSVDKIYKELKNNFFYFANLFARRKRVFFTGKNNFEAIKLIFNAGEEELLIDETEPQAVDKLINATKESKEQYVILLLTGNYPALRNHLISQNFVENRDFVNAVILLPEQHGGIALNSHFITELM